MNMIKKYKFNFDDKLPSDKKIIACSVIRAVRAVFHENNTYYPQIFLDEGLHKLQILQKVCYDRIDVSEGINVNKTTKSKKCNVCHYWYFF